MELLFNGLWLTRRNIHRCKCHEKQIHTYSERQAGDKLKEGDEIHVDYNKKRYTYTITRKYQVDRYAISIEDPSMEAKMTLYSCDLRGEQAGREVIEARPVSR